MQDSSVARRCQHWLVPELSPSPVHYPGIKSTCISSQHGLYRNFQAS